MGLLDKKERILDVVLTDEGRKKLSKNQLNFTYYAFSDEGINYSGSLVLGSGSTSGSVDTIVYRNLAFEADQRKNSSGLDKNTSLKSFLYTIPSKTRVLPEFKASVLNETNITLDRRYLTNVLGAYTTPKQRIKNIKLVMRGSVPKITSKDRQTLYVYDQVYQDVLNKVSRGESIVGQKIGENLVAISNTKVLDTSRGSVLPLAEIAKLIQDQNQQIVLTQIKDQVEEIHGLDDKTIELELKTLNGEFESNSGFLVEVFLSGADGKYTKLIKESVVDPLSDETLIDGFDSFLKLEVDKE